MGLTLTTGLRLTPGPFGPFSSYVLNSSPTTPLYVARHGQFLLVGRLIFDRLDVLDMEWCSDLFLGNCRFWTTIDAVLSVLDQLPLPPSYADIVHINTTDNVALNLRAGWPVRRWLPPPPQYAAFKKDNDPPPLAERSRKITL